jgi:hypothetical protein
LPGSCPGYDAFRAETVAGLGAMVRVVLSATGGLRLELSGDGGAGDVRAQGSHGSVQLAAGGVAARA